MPLYRDSISQESHNNAPFNKKKFYINAISLLIYSIIFMYGMFRIKFKFLDFSMKFIIIGLFSFEFLWTFASTCLFLFPDLNPSNFKIVKILELLGLALLLAIHYFFVYEMSICQVTLKAKDPHDQRQKVKRSKILFLIAMTVHVGNLLI